jgi:hypothetical protein
MFSSIGGFLHCGFEFVIGDDLNALGSGKVGWFGKVVAVVDIASNTLLLVPVVGEEGRASIKAFAKTVLSQTLRGTETDTLYTADELGLHLSEQDAETLHSDAQAGDGEEKRSPLLDAGGCTCFVAGTKVATAHGPQAIETLHVGDTVLAEDPRTKKVESEPVLKVIDDGIKALVALTLSDNETLHVTADHPFWVDSGRDLSRAGWFEAGQLKPGDQIRTADGHDVTVEGVQWNVGVGHVYTLTVAHDHTFFVGAARVLVHNTGRICTLSSGQRLGVEDFGLPVSSYWGIPSIETQLSTVAQRANTLRSLVPGSMWKRVTVAVANSSDGRLLVALNDRAVRGPFTIGHYYDDIMRRARLIDSSARIVNDDEEFMSGISLSSGEHAEELLYRYSISRGRVKYIGVSHYDGPCGQRCFPLLNSLPDGEKVVVSFLPKDMTVPSVKP